MFLLAAARKIPPRRRDLYKPARGGMSVSVISTIPRLSIAVRRSRLCIAVKCGAFLGICHFSLADRHQTTVSPESVTYNLSILASKASFMGGFFFSNFLSGADRHAGSPFHQDRSYQSPFAARAMRVTAERVKFGGYDYAYQTWI
jgi:hypothetical protein